jgi:hypothetical protein
VIVAEPVKCRCQVGVEYPQPPGVLAGCRGVDGHDRVMAAPAGPESVGSRLEPGLPLGLQRVQRQGLKRPVGDHGNSEPATAPVALRHIHPPDGQGPPSGRAVLQPGRHVGLLLAGEHDAPVDPGRPAASVDLRHPPHAHQSAAAGAEHQLLQAAGLSKVPGLRCREDPPSQTPYVLFGLAPVHSVPVQAIVLRSVHQIGVQLVPRFGRPDIFSPQAHQTRVSALSSRAAALSGQLCGDRWRRSQHPVPGFLLPFGHRHSLLGSSCARWGIQLPSRSACRQVSRRTPSGLSRSACDRCGRGGRPLNPGDDGALPASQVRPAGTRRLPAAGPCSPASCQPVGGSANDEASSRIHLRSPVRPSPACGPRTEREPLGTSPGFAPHGHP